MNTKQFNSEKGQAIVYLVLGLVVFLGFVAMAIDGGMVLADRRDAQNATDASALAGAAAAAQNLGGALVDPSNVNTLCSYYQLSNAKTDAEVAAIGRATSNNYTITATSTEGQSNTVYVKCGVSGGPYMDVSVEISKTTQTSFLQVIVPDTTLTNRMISIARLHTARAIGGGNTLVALGLIDNSIDVGGAANLRIMGGGVFGNADADCDGSSSKEFIMVCSGSDVKTCTGASAPIIPDSVAIVGQNHCSGQIHPTPQTGATPLDPNDFVVTPDCSGHEYGAGHAALPLDSNGKLAAGLYCVYGDLDVGKKGGLNSGDGITIYLVNGGFKINANDIINLSSPKADEEPENGAIPGLFLIAPLSNHSSITLNGTPQGYFHGTWLLPGIDMSKWNGTFNGEFRGQMIVRNFNMRGTFDGGMWYDKDWISTLPASIDLLH
jgi:Flp pilus assembly protein TadG